MGRVHKDQALLVVRLKAEEDTGRILAGTEPELHANALASFD